MDYAEFQRRCRQLLEEMPEEKAQRMVELLRTKGGKKGQVYAELFTQHREDARRRREANEAAEAFARHMAARTGRQLRPGVSLDEIARAARESAGDELAAWEMISLSAEDSDGACNRGQDSRRLDTDPLGKSSLGGDGGAGVGGANSTLVERPETQYTRSGDMYVAYQAFGDGPFNIVAVPGRVSNVELIWDDPDRRAFYDALASFARLIIFDKRGTGASDRVVGVPTLEQRLEDVRAVMDAAGVERAGFYGADDGAALAALFAATYPDRAVALMLWEPRARGAWAPDYPWGMREPETPWGGSRYTSPEHIDAGIRIQFPSRSADAEFRRRYVRTLRLSASPTSYAALHRMWFETSSASF